MPASKLPTMPAFPVTPNIDAIDVRQALGRIGARCESEGKDDPNAQWVARLIGDLDGAESRILQLTTSQVARGALEAAQYATGVEVEAPALVVPFDDPGDPDGSSVAKRLGVLVPAPLASDLIDRPSRDSCGAPWSRDRTTRMLAHEFVHLTQAEDTVPTPLGVYGHDPDTAILEGVTECLASVGLRIQPDGTRYLEACDVLRSLLPYTRDSLDVARCLNASTIATRIGLMAQELGVPERQVHDAFNLSAVSHWPPEDGPLVALQATLRHRSGPRKLWATATAL
jgi:hypothetical protein